MKSLKKLGLAIALSTLASSSAFAYIATALPAGTYITDAGIDWTWASPWGTSGEGINHAGPSAHAGWRYATSTELNYLFANLVDDFLNGGSPIESVAYWELDGTNFVNIGDLQAGAIMSGPNEGSAFQCGTLPCEVFYVRDNGNNEVPLPGTLALLGIGALALGLTRRKQKPA